MYKSFILALFFCLALLTSCQFLETEKPDFSSLKASMLEADRAFSQLSQQQGMRAAYMNFMDSTGVLLRPNTLPMVGADAVDYISMGNDSAFTMTWEPKGAHLAEAGDLGYTYGVYSIQPTHIDTTLYGTYVSIWKHQPDGSWKFVLDTGNEGIQMPNP
jgi:ketosteroid isomerase-like protein